MAYGAVCTGSGASDAVLFRALAQAAVLRMGKFNVQQLANTAWAFAAVNQPDEKLLTALARVAEIWVIEFNAIPQNLANTAWAFATLRQPVEKLFMALVRAGGRRLDSTLRCSFVHMLDRDRVMRAPAIALPVSQD